MKKFFIQFLMILFLGSFCGIWSENSSAQSEKEGSGKTALVDEVLEILKSRYAEPPFLSADKINLAMIQGVLESLQGSVVLLSAEEAAIKAPQAPSETQISSLLDPKNAYFRFQNLSAAVVNELQKTIEGWRKENSIEGLVLDLRFLRGNDFGVVPSVVSLFVSEPALLFTAARGNSTEAYKAAPGKETITMPIVLLTNRETQGASELLAAVFQDQKRGLVMGSASSEGRAYETSDVKLSNGQILRFATGKFSLPKGKSLFLQGIKPDVQVEFEDKLEAEVFRQPFKPPVLRPSTRYYSEAILTGRETAPPLRTEKDKPKPEEPASNQDRVLLRAIDFLHAIQSLELSQKPTPK
jgi:hypothetical protein